MTQKLTVENIQGLDRGKAYIIQYPSQISSVDKIKLRDELNRFGIRFVLVPFKIKFAEKASDVAENAV